MRINNNMMAMNTHRQLGVSTNAGAKSMEKLSSGSRINRAGDDAAGLSISEKMRNQIRGLDRASSNAQDGISLIQTAEGALDETHAILKRVRELTVQAGNTGTLEEDDLQAIQDEYNELKEELDGIADRTEFNGKKLLNGSYEGNLQIGANQEQSMKLEINTGNKAGGDAVSATEGEEGTEETPETPDKAGVSAKDLGVDELKFAEKTEDVARAGGETTSNVDSNLEAVDGAISKISNLRSKLGANQNRLEHTIKNLDNAGENLQAAESRIRDTDMAKEMMEQTKQNILQQASTAMLAQANQAPQNVLSLLR